MFLLTILIFIPNACCEYLIPLPNQRNEQVSECLHKIVDADFNFYSQIIFMDRSEEIHPRFPVINFKEHLLDFEDTKINSYIIILNDTNIRNIFEILEKAAVWNSRANFLLFCERLQDDFFEYISTRFIYNIAVIVNKTILTYFPYEEENLNQPTTTSVVLGECDEISKFYLFPNKLPKYWRNSTLKAAIKYFPIWVNCLSGCENKGVEVDALFFVQNKLKFNLDMNADNYSSWGIKHEGRYDQALGALQNKSVHFCIGLFHSNETHNRDFDQTFNYMRDHITWIVPKAERLSYFEKMFSIFDYYTWIGLLISYILTSAILYKFTDSVKHTEYYQKFINCCLCSVMVLMGLPTNIVPKTQRGRYLFAAWSIFSIIINNVSKAVLIYLLNHDVFEKQIKNEKDLMESKLLLMLPEELGNSFKNGNDFDQYVYKNYKVCPTHETCIDKVAYGRNVAAVTTFKRKRILKFDYISSKGETLVYVFKKPIRKEIFNMYFQKGFPALPQINNALIKMKYGGFMRFFERITFNSYDVAKGKSRNRIPLINSNTLTISQLKILFKGYAFGVTLACLIFFMEVLRSSFLRKNQQISLSNRHS